MTKGKPRNTTPQVLYRSKTSAVVIKPSDQAHKTSDQFPSEHLVSNSCRLFYSDQIYSHLFYCGWHTLETKVSVGFWLLAHLTRDSLQAEKKINFIRNWANAQNDNYFTQNC